jgi:hypothetical protein
VSAKSNRGFALVRPCAKCPFRTDVPGYLTRARAVEIATSIANGSVFPCHETTVYDEETEDMVTAESSQFCAGALIAMERMERPNQHVRIAERLGVYQRDRLDMDAPVVGSFAEFVSHHGESPFAKLRDECAAEEDESGLEDCCEVVDMGCEAPAGHMVGGVPVPADNEGIELHHCPSCWRTVCGSCSNDEGVCNSCVEEDENG